MKTKSTILNQGTSRVRVSNAEFSWGHCPRCMAYGMAIPNMSAMLLIRLDEFRKPLTTLWPLLDLTKGSCCGWVACVEINRFPLCFCNRIGMLRSDVECTRKRNPYTLASIRFNAQNLACKEVDLDAKGTNLGDAGLIALVDKIISSSA